MAFLLLSNGLTIFAVDLGRRLHDGPFSWGRCLEAVRRVAEEEVLCGDTERHFRYGDCLKGRVRCWCKVQIFVLVEVE